MKNPFQSTPSVGRATIPELIAVRKDFISIHALRGEGDSCTLITALIRVEISIHALRGEGDSSLSGCDNQSLYFNPRPPWGGRRGFDVPGFEVKNFNPRPPWGGRRNRRGRGAGTRYFSPRPPWGGRRHRRGRGAGTRYFNPRPPWGGRHYVEPTEPETATISIHALRGEGDYIKAQARELEQGFQSTPSVGRATARMMRLRRVR